MQMDATFLNLKIFGTLGIKNITISGNEVTISPAYIWILLICCAIVGYFAGSLNFAIIISKLKYHEDIRDYGSGNAGMTNMIRTYGTLPGIMTLLGDILKAVFSVLLAKYFFGEAGASIAALFCMLGHAFPCWYHFKGGKGVAVTAASILCIEPIVFPCVLVIFVAIVLFTRYISLGSIMGALMYPLILRAFYPHTHLGFIEEFECYPPSYAVVMLTAVVMTLLLLFLHRENMRRLLNHQENKFSLKK